MQCDGRFLFVCRLIVYCALFEKRTNHFHIIKFTWASKRVHWFQYWHVRSIYKHLYCFQLSQSHCHRKRGKTNYLRMKPLYSAYTKREKNAPNINPNVLENRSEHRFYLFLVALNFSHPFAGWIGLSDIGLCLWVYYNRYSGNAHISIYPVAVGYGTDKSTSSHCP